MEIKFIRLMDLRNNENFQFHTEAKLLIETFGAPALRIEPIFVQEYIPAYNRLDDSLKQITKSSFTEQRHTADVTRDGTTKITGSIVNASQNSFDPEIIAAARRLKILFNTYGNVAKLPLNEETSAIYNLVKDVREKYAADAALIGLTPWIDKLDADNRAYEALVTGGYEEKAAMQSEYTAKEARRMTDDGYGKMMRRISAYIEIEGEADFVDFITRLNLQIDKYNNTLAARRGRSTAKKKTDADASTTPSTTTDDEMPDDIPDDQTDDTQNEPLTPPSDPTPRPPRS